MTSTEGERIRSDSRTIILQAALQLFSVRGYDSTSIDDIRQAAGFKSKASLYTHFKSKEEIAIALIQKVLEEANHVVKQACAAVSPKPLHQFVALGRAFVDWGLSHPQEYTFCFLRVQQDILMQGKAFYMEKSPLTLGMILRQFIQELRKNYSVRDIADAALVSMMLGVVGQAVIDQSSFGTIDQETRVQHVLEVCLGMLFTEPVALPE